MPASTSGLPLMLTSQSQITAVPPTARSDCCDIAQSGIDVWMMLSGRMMAPSASAQTGTT